MPKVTVRDLMSEQFDSVTLTEPIVEAVATMTKKGLHYLAVLNERGELSGILTERDMVTNDSYVHLRTLVNLLNQISFYKNDNTIIKKDLKKLLNLQVKDFMNLNPPTIGVDASIEEATQLFSDPKKNPLLVIDKDKKLVGILSLTNLTKLYGVSVRNTMDNSVEANVDNFIKNFEKKFVFVSKARTRAWLIYSLLIGAVGFIVAWMLIIRIQFS